MLIISANTISCEDSNSGIFMITTQKYFLTLHAHSIFPSCSLSYSLFPFSNRHTHTYTQVNYLINTKPTKLKKDIKGMDKKTGRQYGNSWLSSHSETLLIDPVKFLSNAGKKDLEAEEEMCLVEPWQPGESSRAGMMQDSGPCRYWSSWDRACPPPLRLQPCSRQGYGLSKLKYTSQWFPSPTSSFLPWYGLEKVSFILIWNTTLTGQ